MKIPSFFKQTNKTGQETTLHSSALESISGSKVLENETIETELSIPSEWVVSIEQEYVLKFLSNDLPPLKPGQLSLSGISIQENESNGEWNVQAFLRSSLNQSIQLEKINLLLLDSKDQVLASQEFDLSIEGQIAPNTDNPRIFTFLNRNIQCDEIPGKGWKIAFDVQSLMPHKLELEPQWENELPAAKRKALEDLVRNLPTLSSEELNITGFETSFLNNGDLSVSLLIRNGHHDQVEIDELPLELTDANNKTVASGLFKLDKLIVRANTSKPWTFIFPKNILRIENPDFSRWSIKISSELLNSQSN